MSDIVVVGSLNMDMLIAVPHIPKIGETILAINIQNYPGGKGANQAVAARRLGSKVAMIGKVGNDINGRLLLDALKTEGININGVEVSDNLTGTAFINVGEDGDNNIVVYPGANLDIDIEQIDRYRSIIEKSKICIIQLEIPYEVVEYTINFCYGKGIPVIFNPAPFHERVDKEILSKSYIVAPNETELRLLNLSNDKKLTIEEIAEELHKDSCDNLIVTMGENGSIYLNESNLMHFNGKDVKAIDTTAAGDSFIGALATGIVEGKSVIDSIEYASYVSALTVTKLGAQTSLPTRVEVEEFIKNYNIK